ncbi:MAG: ribulose-phosphate 3-epimerase [Chryseolinea sp.]
MNVPIIAPSVLAADFANLARDVEMINQSQADWIHIDIMDGVFVPNFSMGIPVVEAIRRHAKKFLDVHLMIVNPEHHVEAFQRAGANNISVHIEVCRNMHRNIQQIKSLGCTAGIALNPHTPASTLEDIIQDIDLVCVMSVNPGFGAQVFIPHTYKKVRQLREMIQRSASKARIEIDGGVNLSNARQLLEAGADILVAGNFVFSSPDPSSVIDKLKTVSSIHLT